MTERTFTEAEKRELDRLTKLWLTRFAARREAIRQSGRITQADLSIRIGPARLEKERTA